MLLQLQAQVYCLPHWLPETDQSEEGGVLGTERSYNGLFYPEYKRSGSMNGQCKKNKNYFDLFIMQSHSARIKVENY